MASKHKRKTSRPAAPWLSKQMLLPLPVEYVRDVSLANHLALVGCSKEVGLKHSLNELIRLAYLSFFIWDAGYGAEPPEFFLDVEKALDSAVLRAEKTGKWRLDVQEYELMKRIVSVHDEQLSSVSGRNYVAARQRLEALLRLPHTVSPIQKRYRELGSQSKERT